MRILYLAAVIVLELGLVSCSRDAGGPYRDESAARQAGREAYRASQAAKRDAKEAAKELRNAGKAFREGWDEARRQDWRRNDTQRESPPPEKR